MTLNCNLVKGDKTRIWYTGLQLHASCIQPVPLPSRGDTVSTHPGLWRYLLFSSIIFWLADRGVELKRAGPTTKKSVVGLFVQNHFSFCLTFLTGPTVRPPQVQARNRTTPQRGSSKWLIVWSNKIFLLRMKYPTHQRRIVDAGVLKKN